jgi:hypothetical protein
VVPSLYRTEQKEGKLLLTKELKYYIFRYHIAGSILNENLFMFSFINEFVLPLYKYFISYLKKDVKMVFAYEKRFLYFGNAFKINH